MKFALKLTNISVSVMKQEPLSDWLTVNVRSVLYECLGKNKIVFLSPCVSWLWHL